MHSQNPDENNSDGEDNNEANDEDYNNVNDHNDSGDNDDNNDDSLYNPLAEMPPFAQQDARAKVGIVKGILGKASRLL